jgi:polysaccharide biosynthesis protein PslH
VTALRLFLLLPFAPRLEATHGGARVISQFLTEITSRHTVAILCLREADEPGVDPFFRGRCELVEEVVRPSSKKSFPARFFRYLRLVLSLLQLRPVWVTDWTSASFAKQACLIAQKFHPDIIQAEFHVMGQYFSALKDIEARRLLVEHEPSARAGLYIQNLPSILDTLVGVIEKISWRRYEREVYRQVEGIVAFTEADQKSIKEAASQTPIHVISPGTVIPEYPLNPLGSLPPTLLFVGNYYHPPNVDAARRLVHSIFPSVQRRFPETKLFIVGENPPADFKRIDNKNIIVTGRVPAITPYLDGAALLVAPLRLGGGMRIKILEALAAGKAVVTTPLAVEGLDIVDGEQISLAETDLEFAERIIYLLQHADDRLALAQHARVWACDHLGWEGSICKYEILYQDLLGELDKPNMREEGLVNHGAGQI